MSYLLSIKKFNTLWVIINLLQSSANFNGVYLKISGRIKIYASYSTAKAKNISNTS